MARRSAGAQGVLVDLDDTLYPEADFLDLAWRAVAERGRGLGLDPGRLLDALRHDAARGSARGEVIDRALERIDAPARHLDALLVAFRGVEPAVLAPYPGVLDALGEIRRRVPLGLITDGEVTGQQRKLTALGLDGAFDVVVFSDRWGRERRTPHPHPFRMALSALGVPPERAVMIGDRPDRDVAGAVRAGIRAVRVRTGEFAADPDHPGTWLCADTFAAAVRALLPHLAGH